MAAISLDNVSFWAPPALQGEAEPSHPDPSFLPELPLLPTQGQFDEPWTQSGQTQDDPISILSDADSEVSAAERRYTDEDDGEDSDSTLPSISSIVASLTKVRPGKSSRRASETEADAGVDASSVVSPGQAGATLASPDEVQLSQLDITMQESFSEIDRKVTRDMPDCQGVNLRAPTPRSQLNSTTMDNRAIPASQHLNLTGDAVLDNNRSPRIQTPSDYPLSCAHPLPFHSPAEAVQKSVQESELLAGNSCDDTVSASLNTAPTPPLPKPFEGKVSENVTCPSTCVTSEVIEPGSEAGGKGPSTSASPRRSGRNFPQTNETTQSKDSDTDDQGSGGEDRLDQPELQHGEISHLLPASEPSSSDHDDAHQSRKRRRVSKSPPCAVRSALASSRCSRSSRHRRSASRLSTVSPAPGCNVDQSPSSEASPARPEADLVAQFEQWPLKDVILKRITEGSKTTFQLQFEWDTEPCESHSDRSESQSKNGRTFMMNPGSAARSSGERWTPEEEETVRKMKKAGKSWSDIHRALPHRSEGTIQVRYSTKLKR